MTDAGADPVRSASRSGRERILAAAGRLFYEHGFAAVGIDRIIADAEVAKATLYANFGSKDDLVVAYLERADADFWAWIDEATSGHDDPIDTLIGIFEAVEAQATNPGCLGCTFQVTAAEFPDPEHPAHEVAAGHKRAALRRFDALARNAGLTQPDVVAAHLLIMMDGAWAATRMFGADNHAVGLADTVRTLVDAHRPLDPSPSSITSH